MTIARYKVVLGLCVAASLAYICRNSISVAERTIRSDLDLIMKSSRREALVFVEDMATGKPANGVKLLFSDGKKIIGTGTIKKDGVLTQQFGELKSLNDIRVLAIKDGHMASNLLNLSGLGFSKGLAAKGYLYTDRPAYQPGHTVRLRGIIRDHFQVDGSPPSVPDRQTQAVRHACPE